MKNSGRTQGVIRAELLPILAEMLLILERVGEEHWRVWVLERRAEIESWDEQGVRRLLGGYGGMGSFNDIVIHPLNGHSLALDEVAATNDRFDRLRSEAYRHAQELIRTLD